MKNISYSTDKVKNIQGIALLEVLITILVMAIGMLGLAALQVKTLDVTQESYSRAQAVAAIEDATARIRANSAFIATDPATSFDEMGAVINDPDSNAYTANKASGTFYEWCKIGDTPYVPVSKCTGSCDARDLAKADIDAACTNLSNSGVTNASIGAACIDRDGGVDADNCSPGSKMVIYAAWSQEERKDAGDKLVDNTRCQNALDLDAGFSCVIVELVP